MRPRFASSLPRVRRRTWVVSFAVAIGAMAMGVLSGRGGAPPGGAGMRRHDYAPADCNGNGIPDDEDLAQGTVDDANHNGVADDCDPDSALYAWTHNDWQTLAGA